MKVKVNKRHEITLPAEAQTRLGINSGDTFLLNVRDGLIYLVPEPNNWGEALRGVGKEIWEGVDPVEYIRRERGVCQD